jgi:RhoGAP domain.
MLVNIWVICTSINFHLPSLFLSVLQQLPKANYILLSHFLCVLHHISRRSAHNLMSSSNLGVCVGPSLIWGSNPSIAEDLRLMPALVDCLITNCEVLLGPHVSHLLGDPRDSGTEESDCK